MLENPRNQFLREEPIEAIQRWNALFQHTARNDLDREQTGTEPRSTFHRRKSGIAYKRKRSG